MPVVHAFELLWRGLARSSHLAQNSAVMCWLGTKATAATTRCTRSSSASIVTWPTSISVEPPRPVARAVGGIRSEAIRCSWSGCVEAEVVLGSVALSTAGGASECEIGAA